MLNIKLLNVLSFKSSMKNLLIIICITIFGCGCQPLELEEKANNLRYDIPIFEVPVIGKIENYSKGCRISKGNSFNLRPLEVNDVIEHNDRVIVGSDCNLELSFEDILVNAEDLAGHDIVFQIMTFNKKRNELDGPVEPPIR